MIEVRKYIPQVYNQSRDFSVFMGVMQIALNELDLKSKILESLPPENLLPHDLSGFPNIKSDFRGMLKNKGSIECLLYAITVAGGLPISFDEENNYLNNIFYEDDKGNEIKINTEYLDRSIGNLNSLNELNPYYYSIVNSVKTKISIIDLKKILVYYTERGNNFLKLHINLKDLSKIDQGLISKLWYYLEPVNTLILLEQADTLKNLAIV